MITRKLFRKECSLPWKKRTSHWARLTAIALVGGACLTACEDYDLDEKTPEGWGNSIYSWLRDRGNFTNTVRMIEELNYSEVLGKTGSKTLFVADDEAYARFYQNNKWGVSNYEALSESQKKLLLFGSMMDNSMQLGALSSVEGTPPREGEAMRRFASNTAYDSVAVLKPERMPDNPYWQYYRKNGKPIVCMTDNSVVPLVQFVEKQLVNKRITNSDYDFIYNHTTQRQPGDASVNGVQVAEPNIKCSNGFIHRMEEVITPLPNMAEVIASKPNVSIFNRLLERFCAPYPLDESAATQYNYLYGTQVDTIFQKRFFSEKSQGGRKLIITPDEKPVAGTLKYDPEWNAYYAGLDDQSGNIVMQRDMGVMMVPSDEAMTTYWNEGAGRVLKDYYGSWDNVPDDVVSKLINNNMFNSFIASVPSKFKSILNDANDPMGVEESAIDSVWLGCNGAIYLTNKVYSPTSYVSVSFPALINESMRILYWGIEQLQYNVYLNSLNSYYSLFIPTNNSLLEYIDPCSYGKSKTQVLRFHYDATQINKEDRVWASMWNYDPATRTLTDSLGEIHNPLMIQNRLKDILDTHIVIGNVEDGHTFYRTKGGTEIRIRNAKAGAKGMTVEGSYQVNEGVPATVSEVYDQTPKTTGGNGKSYILNNQPILGTRQTVHDVLKSHEEFSEFYELMVGSGLFERKHLNRNATGGDNISVFNTYHYTIYVPTNESIKKLINDGSLPTWQQVQEKNAMGDDLGASKDSIAICDFLKYHIQDNALFIGAEPVTADFETATVDPSTERFYRINAVLSDTGITLTDQAAKHNRSLPKANVVTSNKKLYNIMAREYQYNAPDASEATMIETSSSAVIHLIDRPLRFK